MSAQPSFLPSGIASGIGNEPFAADGDYDYEDDDDADDNMSANSANREVQSLSENLKLVQDELKDLKTRMKRRTTIIEELRKAYLRDVVALKHVVDQVLTGQQNETVVREYTDHLPSVDLRAPLILHAPKEAEFRQRPCDNCGGHIDIVMNDSAEVGILKRKLEDMKIQEETLRLTIASGDLKLEKAMKEHDATLISHREEKLFCYREIKRHKEELAASIETIDKMELDERRLRQREEDVRKENDRLRRDNLRVDTLEKELVEFQARMPALLEDLRNKEAWEGLMRVKVDGMEKEIQDLTTERDQLLDQLDGVTSDLKGQSERQGRYKTLADELQVALEMSNRRVIELERTIGDLTNDLKVSEESAAAEAEGLMKTLDAAREETRATQLTLKESRKECLKVQADLKFTLEKLNQRDETVARKTEEVLNLNTEYETLKEEHLALAAFYGVETSLAARTGGTSPGKQVSEGEGQDDSPSGSSSSPAASSPAGRGRRSSTFKRKSSIRDLGITAPTALQPMNELEAMTEEGEGGDDDMDEDNGNSYWPDRADQDAEADAETETEMVEVEMEVEETVEVEEDITGQQNDESALQAGKPKTVVTVKKIVKTYQPKPRTTPTAKKASTPSKKATSSPLDPRTAELTVNSEGNAIEDTNIDINAEINDNETNTGSSDTAAEVEEDQGENLTLIDSEETTPPGGADSSSANIIPGNANQPAAPNASKTLKPKVTETDTNATPTTATASAKKLMVTKKAPVKKMADGTTDGEGVETQPKAASVAAPTPPVPTKAAPALATVAASVVKRYDTAPKAKASIAGVAGAFKSAAGGAKKAPFVPPVEEEVLLIEPPENASSEHLQMRSELLNTLTSYIPGNNAKKAFNALAPVISKYGELLHVLMDALWTAMLVTKRSLDFDVKVQQLFDGLMRCEGLSSQEVTKLCAQLAPIAGLTVGTDALTGMWEKEVNADEGLVAKLTSFIVPESGDVVSLPYFEYFTIENSGGNTSAVEKYTSLANRASKAMTDMAHFDASMTGDFTDLAIDVLREWSKAKTVLVDLEQTVTKAQEAVKKEFQMEIALLKREMQVGQTRYQSLREANRKLEDDIKGLNNTIRALEALPGKIEACEKEFEALAKEHQTLKALSGEQKLSIHSLRADLAVQKDQLDERIAAFNQLKGIREGESKQFAATLASYEQEIALAKRTKAEMDDMIAAEKFRVDNMRSVGNQCQAASSEAAIQTEFITSEMSLRPAILARNNAVRSAHPIIFAASATPTFNESYVMERVLGVPHIPASVSASMSGIGSPSRSVSGNNPSASFSVAGDEDASSIVTGHYTVGTMTSSKSAPSLIGSVVHVGGEKKVLSRSRGVNAGALVHHPSHSHGLDVMHASDASAYDLSVAGGSNIDGSASLNLPRVRHFKVKAGRNSKGFVTGAQETSSNVDTASIGTIEASLRYLKQMQRQQETLSAIDDDLTADTRSHRDQFDDEFDDLDSLTRPDSGNIQNTNIPQSHSVSFTSVNRAVPVANPFHVSSHSVYLSSHPSYGSPRNSNSGGSVGISIGMNGIGTDNNSVGSASYSFGSSSKAPLLTSKSPQMLVSESQSQSLHMKKSGDSGKQKIKEKNQPASGKSSGGNSIAHLKKEFFNRQRDAGVGPHPQQTTVAVIHPAGR